MDRRGIAWQWGEALLAVQMLFAALKEVTSSEKKLMVVIVAKFMQTYIVAEPYQFCP